MDIRRIMITIFIVLTLLATGQSIALAAVVPDSTLIWLRPEYESFHLLFMESVDLSPTTPLPAEVKVGVPKGSVIMWVGEVNRADSSKDVETTYKVNHMADYDEVVFTLKQNMTGQVEVRWDNGLVISGTKRKIDLNWTQHYESNNVMFLFRQPEGSADVKISPLGTSMQRGPDGSTFYQTDSIKLMPGQKQQLTISYSRSENATQEAMQSQSQGTTTANKQTDSMFTMVLGTVLVILVLAAFIFRAKKMGQEEPFDEDSDEEDEDSEQEVDTEVSDYDDEE